MMKTASLFSTTWKTNLMVLHLMVLCVRLGPPLEDGRQDSAIYAYNDGHFKFWEKGITNQY